MNPPEQPVAETPSQPQAPNLDSVKAEYEAKLAAAKKEAAEAEENLKASKENLMMSINKKKKNVPKI